MGRWQASAFGIGYVITAVILVLAPWQVGPANLTRVDFKNGRYWSETGIGLRELSTVLSTDTCFATNSIFLACISSLSAILERSQKQLNFDGTVSALQAEPKTRIEKDLLSAWNSVIAKNRFKSVIPFTSILRDVFVNTAPEDQSQLAGIGINAYLSAAQDPHTYILPIRLYEEIYAKSDSVALGLGMVLRRIDGRLEVKRVLPGSAAERSAIYPGDFIDRIGGTNANTLRVSELNPVFWAEGPIFQMRIQRGNLFLQKEFSLSDQAQNNVTSTWIPNKKNVLVLAVQKFSEGVCTEFSAELNRRISERPVGGLVLDLRDNPGGQLNEANCLLSKLVPKGKKLFYTLSEGDKTEYQSYGTQIYSGPMAVLVNSGSASASEIVAGVIKDLQRGYLVGSRTYGKGSFQNGHLWALNSKIALFKTSGLYYFASGWTPQLAGIEPDVYTSEEMRPDPREGELYYNPTAPESFVAGRIAISSPLSPECKSSASASAAAFEIAALSLTDCRFRSGH